jgi:hypothetical protein
MSDTRNGIVILKGHELGIKNQEPGQQPNSHSPISSSLNLTPNTQEKLCFPNA